MFHRKTTPHQSLARIFASLGLLLLMLPAAAWSQATQGSILGTLKDSTGAIIPGAVVTLVNTDEGVSRTTQSNAIGSYVFLDAVAAHYTLTVTAPGFEKYEADNLALTVRQQLRIDARLTVGAVQQQVTVNGASVSAIETDSPTISATFTSAQGRLATAPCGARNKAAWTQKSTPQFLPTQSVAGADEKQR